QRNAVRMFPPEEFCGHSLFPSLHHRKEGNYNQPQPKETTMHVPLFRATLVAAVIFALAIPVHARITRLVVEHTETLGPDGYQKLTGHAYGELDPKLPLNAIITDLEFAPRNARGMVEYVATFTIIAPSDLAKARGVL